MFFPLEDIAEMFQGDVPEKILGSVLAILCMAILAGVAYGIFYLIDSVGVPVYESNATIKGFTFTDEQTIITMVGKVMIPQTIDAVWGVTLDVDSRSAWCGVKESYYDTAKEGDVVSVEYTKGRLRSKIRIKSLSVR